MPDNLYRRGKTWWGRAKVAGTEHRKSLRTASKTEARKRRDAWLKELGEAAVLGIERVSWKDAVVQWHSEYLTASVKPATAARYLSSLAQHDAILGNLYVHEIGTRTMAAMVTAARKRGATNRTIKNDLTAVSSVLSFCVTKGWRDDNPARIFDRRVVRTRNVPRPLAPDGHIEAMIAAAPGNFARMVALARQTGMREEELASLEHTEISLPDRRVTLPRTKTDRPRTLDLNDDAVGTIRGTPRHLLTPFLFWHEPGMRYRNVSSQFAGIRARVNKARKAQGLPPITFRFHDLRHRYAVDYLRGGGFLYDLQQLLGHSSIRQTEEYLAYLTPEEQRRAKYGSAQNGAQV